MRTEWIAVADGVELAVDRWAPAADEATGDGPARAAAAAHPRGAEAGADTSVGRPAFILVHGLASNARLWDGVAESLAAHGHAVAALEVRGHGRSSKPAGPYDTPTVAADVAAVIGALADREPRFDRPIVAGQSWGGNVVLELAASQPAIVRGVVCVDGGWLEPAAIFPDWDACLRALAPPRLVGRPLAEVEECLRTAHRDWPEAGIRGTLANFEVRRDGTIAPWLTYDRHVAILRGLWEHHPSTLYPRVTAPVLLVPADTGAADWTERKRRDVAAAAAALPRARVRWFAGDHDIHAQHPGELADVMATLAAEGFFA